MITIHLHDNALRAALKAAAKKDASRPCLEHIRIEAAGNVLHVIGCDGVLLLAQRYHNPEGVPEPTAINIPPEVVKAALAKAKKGSPVPLEHRGGETWCLGKTLFENDTSLRYPDWRRPLPTSLDHETPPRLADFNPELVTRLFDAVREASGERDAGLPAMPTRGKLTSLTDNLLTISTPELVGVLFPTTALRGVKPSTLDGWTA